MEEPRRQDIPVELASRLREISDAIFRIASGDFEVDLEATPGMDEVDAIARGVSMLAEEIGERVRELEHYRDLVENQSVGISLVDENEYFVFCNQAAHLIFGVPEGDLVGRKLKEFMDASAFEQVLEQTGLRRRGERSTYELEIVRPDGARRYLHITASPRFGPRGDYSGALGIFNDITEQKRAEDRERRHLREMAFLSETAIAFVELPPEEDIYQLIGRYLQELVESSFVVIVSYDETRETVRPRAVLGNAEDIKSAVRTLGWEPLSMEFPIHPGLKGKFLGAGLVRLSGGIHELMYPILPEEVWTSIVNAFDLGSIYAMPIRRRTEVLGGAIILLGQGRELENPDLVEAYIYQAAVAMQHRRAEEALQESEERFRKVTQSAIDAIITCDSAGLLTSWNEGAGAMFGYAEDEVLGRSLRMLIPERQIEDYTGRLRAALAEFGPEVFTRRAEAFGLRKSGEEFPLEVSATSWKAGGAFFFTAIIRDITERRKREAEITLMNQELRAYDHTVSHDLKGPLATVKVAVEYLKSGLGQSGPDDPATARVIETIDKNIEKVTGILDDLLGMAEVGERARVTEDVDVNEVVREVASEAEQADIKITFRSNDLGKVRANRVHVYQVFSNLMRNAVEHVDAESPEVSVLRTGDHRYLVRDNGAGIPDYLVNTLFLPFVRGEDGGRGLGLSIVKRIVDAYGGEIRAYNDGGACFEFSLYDFEPADQRPA
jgi:PAS domain S-box-containing protein